MTRSVLLNWRGIGFDHGMDCVGRYGVPADVAREIGC